MRARKNPPPFTLENLIGELKPGRGYSIDALVLMFGVSADEVRRMVFGAMMLAKLKESKARRGMRVVYWVPKVDPQNIAQPRALCRHLGAAP